MSNFELGILLIYLWTIYRMLKPNPERCTASPTSLNNYYSSLAANLTGFTSTSESNVPSNTNENQKHLLSNQQHMVL